MKRMIFGILADIDMKQQIERLGFDYRKTDWNVRYSYTDGKWSPMEITQDEYIKIHVGFVPALRHRNSSKV